MDYFMRSSMEIMAPFDVTMQVSHDIETHPDFDFSALTDEVFVLRGYVMHGLFEEGIGFNQVFADFFAELTDAASEFSVDLPPSMRNVPFMGFRLEEVNTILRHLGRDEIQLADREVLLMVFAQDFDESDIAMDSFVYEGNPYQLIPYFGLNGAGEGLWNDFNGIQSNAVLVFEGDSLLESGANRFQTALHSFDYRGDLRDYEPTLDETMDSIVEAAREQLPEGQSFESFHQSRNMMIQMGNLMSILLTFISHFIGIIFLLVSLSTLALQQLVDAVESEERYIILQKMGVEAGMRAKSLCTQVAVYFLIPLVVATLHSIVAISFLYGVLNRETLAGFHNIALMLSSFGFILGVYLIYFGVTYWQGKRMLVK